MFSQSYKFAKLDVFLSFFSEAFKKHCAATWLVMPLEGNEALSAPNTIP